MPQISHASSDVNIKRYRVLQFQQFLHHSMQRLQVAYCALATPVYYTEGGCGSAAGVCRAIQRLHHETLRLQAVLYVSVAPTTAVTSFLALQRA